MLGKIFGGKSQPEPTTYYKTLNDYAPYFSNFNGGIFDSDVGRTCIDAIARNAAKLKPRHIRRLSKDKVEGVGSNIEYLLGVRPNIYMNAYDFLYKVVAQLYTSNNAFIYIRYEAGKIVGFYPINYSSLEMVEYLGDLYCKFTFATGFKMTVPYSEMIHLRRHFNRDDLFGEDSLKPFKPTLSLMQTINQGIVNSIKSSARLRGLLKYTATIRPEDLVKQRDQFINDYLRIDNNGGIGVLDAKADFIPVNLEPKMADGEQMKQVRESAYRYFGISEKIINSTYDENEWNAFYESVIEPIAVQLSLEFTSKIFTSRELGHGNEIVFEANRLQYASAKTKIELLKQLMPLGLLSVNEGREIFNMSAVEDGDKRIISLNYIDAALANEYQGAKGGEEDEGKEAGN